MDSRHLGANLGFLAVLHTWGQNLRHHPHVHCVIPAGGISAQRDQWIGCRENFFLPVRVLSRLYRGLFLHHLEQAYAAGKLQFHGKLQELNDPAKFKSLLKAARKTEWVVYSKPPFGGPSRVLEYLGRYTHRIAISNDRLVRLKDGKVTFRWRDYKDGNRQKLMTLDANEFIRRFLLHVFLAGSFASATSVSLPMPTARSDSPSVANFWASPITESPPPSRPRTGRHGTRGLLVNR